MQFRFRIATALSLLLFFQISCSTKEQASEESSIVRVRLAADPGKLNPLLSLNGYAEQVQGNIFLPLQDFDPVTMMLQPVLASQPPVVEPLNSGPFQGGVAYHFQLRTEAAWDNGSPVSASDYLFTVKALLNPEVAAPYRSFFDFVEDVVIDESDPKRFTVFTNTTYILAEAALSTLAVLPEYIYDPEASLSSFSVRDLQNDSIANLRKAPLQAFAVTFQSALHNSDPKGIAGCGPYTLAEWKNGERILLQKKVNWWGDPLAKKVKALEAKPGEILYKIIPDNTAALTALKDGQLDVMAEIEPLSFLDLQQNTYVSNKFDFYTPPVLSYYYIALNSKRPALADVRVRKALAQLTDVDQIIQSAMHGLAERVNGPIDPSSSFYDHNLPLIPFDLSHAKILLAESGWTDINGDGILDKMINGRQESLNLRFLYSTGNPTGEAVALLLQQATAKAGVGILIEGMVFGQAVKAYRSRDYDLAYFQWSNLPGPPDLKQIWHTSSDTPTGANRTGFGDSASDALIDSVRTTLVEEKQKDLYLRIQRRIYAEQPYIFLYAPLERIAINKKFKVGTSALRPGFFVRQFHLQPSTVNH